MRLSLYCLPSRLTQSDSETRSDLNYQGLVVGCPHFFLEGTLLAHARNNGLFCEILII